MRNSQAVIPDPDFYKADRDLLASFVAVDNRLSSKYIEYDIDADRFAEKANVFLVRNFYSLFNYITGEKSPSLRVNPRSNASYCSINSNMIQLGTLSFCTPSEQQLRVDAMYAVMIHEMFHKRYTNADFLRLYMPPGHTLDEMYSGRKATSSALTKVVKNELFRELFNIIEDHRIERLGIAEFPGYVFYFDQLRYFAIDAHKKRDPALADGARLVIDYLMYRVLMPELLPAFSDYVSDFYTTGSSRYSEKQVRSVMAEMDSYLSVSPLPFSDSMSNVLQAVSELIQMIPMNMRKELEKAIEDGEDNFNGISSPCGTPDTISEEYSARVDDVEEAIASAMERENKEMCSRQKEEGGTARSRSEKIEIIDSASGQYSDFTIYNPRCNAIDRDIYDESKDMSKNIASALGSISSRLNRIDEDYEQDEGDIDEDEIYSIAYSKSVFYEERERQGFDFDLGILVDESGSMSLGGRHRMAKVAALGCILATKDSEHVNLFVYGHSQGRHHRGHGGTELYEYYNVKRGVSDWRNIFSVGAAGGNADGYAIAKVGEIMKKDSASPRKMLIVISDGQPSANNYSGTAAEKHVREVVELLERSGIKVVQICIANIERSAYMFNNFIPFDSMGKFIIDFKMLLMNELTRYWDTL